MAYVSLRSLLGDSIQRLDREVDVMSRVGGHT